MRKLPVTEIHRATLPEYHQQPKLPLVAVLDNIRSRGNVGTILRSADAFALQRVYLCGYTPTPPHPEIRKTALDAELSVDWRHTPTTLEALHQLRNEGYTLLALEHTDRSHDIALWQPPANGRVALVLGNEVFGVEQDVLNACDAAVEIPQFGTKHSLNVAVAAGVAFYELRKRLAVQ
jgi:tRNA G18 (ribose-2'-O)-methylase SpoU